MSRKIVLDVFSDVVCPWCFIGKRRLQRTLQAESARDLRVQVDVDVRWHAFELQPDIPSEGYDAKEFYVRKFGSAARRDAAFKRVTDVGREEDIAFDFSRMRRAPNSTLAHRAIKLAAVYGGADTALEALFRAFFTDGADIGQVDEIVAAFARHRVPIDGDELRRELAQGAGAAEVAADLAEAARLGVAGVPFFLANGQYALSGAYPPEVLARLLAIAAEREPAPR